MSLTRLLVSDAVIETRMRRRLAAGSSPDATSLAWTDHTDTLLLRLATLKVRATDAWVTARLSVGALDGSLKDLQLLFFVGRDGEGDRLNASGAILGADAEAAQLAKIWGPRVLSAAWDGVLDVIEGALHAYRRRHQNSSVDLHGFSCGDGALRIDLEVAV